MEQAIAVIGERGYFGFTLEDLAARCDLTKPGVLHHFPSKERVLLGLLQELEARETVLMQPLADAALGVRQGDAGKAAVLAALRAAVCRSSQQPLVLQLLGELQSEALSVDHPAHDWWRQRIARTLGFFADLLRPFLRDPERRARLLLATVDGLALQWLHADRSFDLLGEWDAALETMLPELDAGNTSFHHPDHG